MTPGAQPEGWTEVQVLVPDGWAEVIAAALAEPPCTAVVFGPPSLSPVDLNPGHECLRTYLPTRVDTPDLRASIEARVLAAAAATGDAELAGLALRFRALPPEDYATSWRKVWRPFRAGRLCVVTPDWQGTLRPDDLRLSLEPKSSFGTGRHATTRTCLRVLQERPLAGARVLDAGTGTGLLAVAAALLGAREAVGFDIDPESQTEARDLAAANGVADRCDFRRGGFEVLGPARAEFDVVLANLYADLVQDVAGDLARRLRPGGWFAFSGCARDRRTPTRAAIEAAGLPIEVEHRRGRWHTFVGAKPAGAG